MRFQKFVKQYDKPYVTSSIVSSIKENEKRRRKDGSAPPNSSGEQLPSTSKQGKKTVQLKSISHVRTSKPEDDVLIGKDKKEGSDDEDSKKTQRSATSHTKDCDGLNDHQPGVGTVITQLHNLKKKQVNNVAVSIASGNNSQAHNMHFKTLKSKCKEGEVLPAKKYKKDICSGNKLADGMQVVIFIRLVII